MNSLLQCDQMLKMGHPRPHLINLGSFQTTVQFLHCLVCSAGIWTRNLDQQSPPINTRNLIKWSWHFVANVIVLMEEMYGYRSLNHLWPRSIGFDGEVNRAQHILVNHFTWTPLWRWLVFPTSLLSTEKSIEWKPVCKTVVSKWVSSCSLQLVVI